MSFLLGAFPLLPIIYGVVASLVCVGIAWWALWHFAGPRDLETGE